MAITEVEKALIDEGIHAINFFNGRLLTAKDLTREQKARQDADAYLGKALGGGVAYGLEVTEAGSSTITAPILSVSQGLAVNRAGQAMKLGTGADVKLVRPTTVTGGTPRMGSFSGCATLLGGTYVAGPGVYLLTIASACATKGRAPVSGLDPANARCNSDVVVETVQFRLLWLDVEKLGLSFPQAQPKEESLFRNQLASRCLGLTALSADPFSTDLKEPLASFLGAELSDVDVPLALVYWTSSGGVRFIDEWAVRRRVVPPAPSASAILTLNPLRAALGEARLLQFEAQLTDLLKPNLKPSEHRIEDYFRFVPPAACLPVTGAGSPTGLSPSQFLSALTTGAPDRMRTGMAAAILAKSIYFETLDLTQKSFLQVYEIDENAQAVSAGSAKQLYQLYVSRSLNGPAGGDGVKGAFEDAWTVYRGLIRRRVFMPLGSTPEEASARIGIAGAVRDVMDVANRGAAKAAAWSLDTSAALQSFDLLYTVQQDFNQLLGSDIPGISDTQERKLFASVLDQYLNHTIPGPAPGLKSALDNSSLGQAVEAQEAINQFVGTWTGEGVAIGPFGFTFSRSDGTDLVPGAAPSAQYFTLSNGTDRTLTMKLSAEASSPAGDWSKSTRILGAVGGGEIDQVTLGSGASREIVVMVGAPADALVGDAVTLTLTAEVGPPTSRTSTYTNATLLKVASSAGGPVAGHVEIADHRLNPPGIDPANIAPNSIFRLLVSVKYAAGDGTAQDFDLDLTVKSGDASIWVFRNDDTGTQLPTSPTGDGFTLRMSSVPADESPTVGRIRIQAPAQSAAADRTVTLGLSIRSVDLETPISHTYSQSIMLVVKHS